MSALRLNVGVLSPNVGVLRLNVGILRLNVDILRLNVDVLRLNVDILRLTVAPMWASEQQIHSFTRFLKAQAEGGTGKDASRRPEEAMGKQAAPPYEVYTSY